MIKMILKYAWLKLNYYWQSKKISDLSNNVTLGHRMKISAYSDSIITIGSFSTIHGALYVEEKSTLVIGANTTVRFGSEINCAEAIKIGNNVIISNNVFITDNDNHPVAPEERLKMTNGDHEGDLWRNKYANKSSVIIEDNVWIGQNSVVLKGARIGQGSIVAAYTIVTKDIPPYSLAYGNPAKIVKGKYLD